MQLKSSMSKIKNKTNFPQLSCLCVEVQGQDTEGTFTLDGLCFYRLQPFVIVTDLELTHQL